MPRVIVFDLDDTLYAERDYVTSGFRRVGRWLEERHGLAGCAAELLADLERGRRRGAFDRLLARRGLSGNLVPELLAVFRDHRPAIGLRPGMRDLLVGLRGSRPLGVLTDGPLESQRRKIEALGLESLVDAIVVNDELGVGHWKPSTSGFERIEPPLSGLPGRPAAGFCYVGDNPAKDFVAARRRGWLTIELRSDDRLDERPPAPGPAYEPDRMVEGVAELAELLEDMP